LAELGYSSREIDELAAEGVVRWWEDGERSTIGVEG
jgi:hypothetical protein